MNTTLMIYSKHRFEKAAFGVSCSVCGATFFKAPAPRSFYNRCGEVAWHAYDQVPSAELKTTRQLEKLRLKLLPEAKPSGYYYHPLKHGEMCFLYTVADCEPMTAANKKAAALVAEARKGLTA